MAFSAGFSPHPKVSYAGAAPTGMASEAEYVEIGVVEDCNPAELTGRLDGALPSGLDIMEIVVAGSGSLADRLQASAWEALVPGVDRADAERAARIFLGTGAVMVERLSKHGMRSFDTRAAVISLTVRDNPAGPSATRDGARPCAILDMVVRHTTPAVRPDDILAGLRHVANLAPQSPPLVTRLAQGPLDAETGTVSDPLAPDRSAASAADEVTATGAGRDAG